AAIFASPRQNLKYRLLEMLQRLSKFSRTVRCFCNTVGWSSSAAGGAAVHLSLGSQLLRCHSCPANASTRLSSTSCIIYAASYRVQSFPFALPPVVPLVEVWAVHVEHYHEWILQRPVSTWKRS